MIVVPRWVIFQIASSVGRRLANAYVIRLNIGPTRHAICVVAAAPTAEAAAAEANK